MVKASGLLARWLPDGRTLGKEFTARNPCRRDRHDGSFKVNLCTGKWADFATDARGGDAISLAAYTARYELSTAEASLYTAVTDYVRQEMNRADRIEGDGKRRPNVGFALQTLQRRLASSPEAIYQSLRRRRERLERRLEEEGLRRRGQDAGLSPATRRCPRPHGRTSWRGAQTACLSIQLLDQCSTHILECRQNVFLQQKRPDVTLKALQESRKNASFGLLIGGGNEEVNEAARQI